MTISSSLNASVAGLAANANRLSTISDNIANSATFGYKRSVADFSSLVVNSGPQQYVAGGVRSTSFKLVDQRGPLISTSNPTDLAVAGRGMLPVTTDTKAFEQGRLAPMQMVTTGSFRPDEAGYLRSATGLVLMGWPADANGNIANSPRDTQAGLMPIRIDSNQFWGEPTTRMNLTVNLPASGTLAGSSGFPEEMSVQYYDNLGNPERLSVSYVPTVPAAGASNQWTMILTDSASGGAVVGEYVLNFDDSRATGGTLQSVVATTGGAFDPVTGAVEVNVAGGPLLITLGQLNSSTGLTQLSDTFAPVNLAKNGSPAGNLSSIEVDDTGYVRAFYDVGTSRVLYQVPLIDVRNPNGLQAMDGQTYSVTRASGPMFLWDAGTGPTGDIVGFAREESATDVAVELTQLIQTQRAYSSNAKVVQTVDEMLQETTNIKR